MTERTRVYAGRGHVAHLALEGMDNKITECGLWHPDQFRGTGSQDEYERAARLPLCKRCAPDELRPDGAS